MKRAIYAALWEWSPGVVAGLFPLLIFLLSAGMPGHVSTHSNSGPYTDFTNELLAHMLVLGIVSCAVTVVTSFARLLTGRIPNFLRDGRGPVGLVMLLLFALMYMGALYTSHQNGHRGPPMWTLTLLGLGASLTISLYMEFAIARMNEIAKAKRKRKKPFATTTDLVTSPESEDLE